MKKNLLFLLLFQLNFIAKAQWIQTNGPESIQVTAMISKGSKVFIGTYGKGVFVSNNNGSTWSPANTGLNFVYEVTSFAVNGSDIFASTNGGGIYKSSNDGANWTYTSTGIALGNINALTIKGNYIFAGTNGDGIHRASLNNFIWSSINSGLGYLYIKKMFSTTNYVIASTTMYPLANYISANNGNTWTSLNLSQRIYDMIKIDSTWYAATTLGVYKSNNDGLTWTTANNALSNLAVYAIVNTGTHLVASTWYQGVYISADNGLTWTQSNAGLHDYSATCITSIGSNVFLGTSSNVMLSSDNGLTWNLINNGLIGSTIDKIVINQNNNNLYALTLYVKCFKSIDNGNSWPPLGIYNHQVYNIEIVGTKIYVMTDQGVLLSNDNGITWVQLSTLLSGLHLYTLIQSGNEILVGSNGGVSKTSDDGLTWFASYNGLPPCTVYTFIKIDSTIIAGTSVGLYSTNNNGNSWNAINNNLTGIKVFELVKANNDVVAKTNLGLVLSSDNCLTWTNIDNAITNFGAVSSIAVLEDRIFVSCGNGVYFTADKGNNWTDISSDLPNETIGSIAIVENKIFAGVQMNGIYVNESALLGARENKLTNNAFEIYPNPIFRNCQSFKVKSRKPFINATVNISNTLGQSVYTGMLNNNNEEIDVNWNESGLYIVKIADKENIYFERLIVH